MTKQKTRDRESSLNEISTLRLPAFIHSHNLTEYELTSGSELKKRRAAMTVRIEIIQIDPAPIIPAIVRLSLAPERASTRKLRKGIAGISAIRMLIYFLIKFNPSDY
jgi:hypothetical protein